MTGKNLYFLEVYERYMLKWKCDLARGYRLPKMAVPTRTRVAPAAIARG